MDIEIKVPDIGIDKVEVIEILVKINDFVSKEQTLIVVEGEKASMEIPSPYSGRIKEIKVRVSDFVKTNSVIFLIDTLSDNVILNKSSLDHINTESDHDNHKKIQNNITVHASPLIRRLARSLNIDLNNIIGTGRKNRIIKYDLDNYLTKNHSNLFNTSSNFIKKDNFIKKNDFSRFGQVEEVSLNKIKKFSGESIFQNWANIPHVTQFDQVDITELELFRKKYNSEKSGDFKNKLTILPFIIKVICKGLKKFPYFNSSISWDNKIIFLKKYFNIGIAVDTLDGLLVPVIKDVNNKSVLEIFKEILEKSQKARDGKLSILDMQGGCFTISNLGGIGGSFFSPIINGSEAAILGVSRASYQPFWNGEKFIPKLMLPLSLSYDHRIIDGADGARFISFINQNLFDIRLLLM
ncbi:2-oxo acid dehydrogenase subunit E2 [Buchnera aphidicola]|uniref:2-oxo acid dehydrogenase subunit E2 n=1 Tax=Buchnera aphidicola TaxID=9 RepID=UPI0034648554